MQTSREDRSNIEKLYYGQAVGVSNKPSLPQWTRPPTKIQPSNGPHRSGGSTNPFAEVGVKNVGKSKAANGGTSQQGASWKKARSMRPKPAYDEFQSSNVAKTRTLTGTPDHRAPKRQRLQGGQAHSPSIIDLSVEDEINSDSQSNIPRISGLSRESNLAAKKAPPIYLAKDGPDMRKLDAKTHLVEDPIEPYPSSPPLKPLITTQAPPNVVPSRIETYERLLGDLPKEDLRAHIKKPPSRNHAPLLFIPSLSNGKSNKRKRRTYSLPVVQSCLAPTMNTNEGRLSWDDDSLTFKQGEDTIVFSKRDIQEYLFTPPPSTSDPRALIRLEHSLGRSNTPPLLMLGFHKEHHDWQDDSYVNLLEWLKSSCKKSTRSAQTTIDNLWAPFKKLGDECHRKRSEVGSLGDRGGSDCDTLSDGDSSTTRSRYFGHNPFGHRPDISTASTSSTRGSRPAMQPRRLLGNVNPSNGESKSPAVLDIAQDLQHNKAIPNTVASKGASLRDPAPPLRRSTRQSNSETSNHPLVDQDEVILVYPQGVPGKVNITNGDVARLQPGEFLNDSLIEFGLKLWLKDLEEKNPELAKQVHVFSSFFYKKLNKRNTEEGYHSVRKWTAKFDLFEKKYIIVPINEHMHWYLALIYEPEHVVSSPSPRTSAPSASQQTEPTVNPVENSLEIEEVTSGGARESLQHQTSSERGIEEDLTNLTQACSISAIADTGTEHGGVEEIDVMNIDSPTVAENTAATDERIEIDGEPPHSTRSSPMRMISPEIPEVSSRSKGTSRATTSSANGDDADDLNIEGDSSPPPVANDTVEGIPPDTFYGTASTRSGRQYEKHHAQQSKPRPRRSDVPQILDDAHIPNRTYILTLDSLGSKHLQALRQLTKYLKFEAKDKKGIDATHAKIETRHVNVPTQPNFCDCGIYLLHLAETFISDPKFYMDKVFTTTSKTPLHQKQLDWHDSKVGTMREALIARINELSNEWKLLQTKKPASAVKEQDIAPAITEPSSDSDIDIIEHTVPPTKGKGKTPHKQTAAARLR